MLPVVRPFSSANAAGIDLKVREDGVAIVRFSDPTEKMNTLSDRMFNEFESIMQKLETDSAIKSVVFISGKPDNFIAGADIKMLVRKRQAS